MIASSQSVNGSNTVTGNSLPPKKSTILVESAQFLILCKDSDHYMFNFNSNFCFLHLLPLSKSEKSGRYTPHSSFGCVCTLFTNINCLQFVGFNNRILFICIYFKINFSLCNVCMIRTNCVTMLCNLMSHHPCR